MAKKKIQVVFTGRRLNSKRQTCWRFEVLPKRTAIYFGQVSGVSIGWTYEAIRESGHTSIDKRRPKLVDRPMEESVEWEAEDALVDAKHAEDRQRKKIESLSRPAVRAAVAAIRPLLKEVSFFDAHKLANLLVREALTVRRRK